MTTRQYAQKSIFDLEAIFERSRNNASELEVLLNELTFRNTAKARTLTTKIEQARTALSGHCVVSMSGSSPSARHPGSASTQSSQVSSRDAPATVVQQRPKANPAPVVQQQFGEDQIDLGPPPSFSPTGKSNDAPAILAAWTALEALSPQGYKRPEDMATGDRSRVALLERGVPWGPNARSKPSYKLYFEVVLGSIALDKATDELVKVFGEDEERSRPDGKKAAIGSILIDKEGYVLEDKGVAVSSFAWALKPALDLKLGSLGNWPNVEPRIIEHLDRIVRRHNEDGEAIPIDLDVVLNAYKWLVSQFGVPEHLVEPPTFAIKVFHHFKAKTPPEPSLLNSFYLEDLGEATKLLETGKAGTGLRRYMGIGRPDQKIDVLSPISAVEPFVAPSLMPQARWPSKGGYPLVLLQQAAVNAARAELNDAPGIIGVNGPPGTGKTTLLRDIVVGCILDRATAMCGFNKPQDAFSTTGEKLAFGSNAFLHFYKLHASLRGHEIVVASSNNKAVENVSKELPLKEANGRHEQIAYFRSISDLIANPKRAGYFKAEAEAEGDIPSDPVETWGLIAAALGKSSNRGAFQQSFWWNEDGGFLTYLKAARGLNVLREIKDEQTGEIIDRVMPSVVVNERPSTNEVDALAAWRKARTVFLKLKETVDAEIASIEEMRRDIQALKGATTELQSVEQRRPSLNEAVEEAHQTAESCQREHEKAKSQIEQDKIMLDSHLAGRPGFFSRLFATAAWKSWRSTLQKLSATLQQSVLRAQETDGALELARTEWSNTESQLQQLDQEISSKCQAVSKLKATEAKARNRMGDRIVDERFFEREHEAIHLTAPWLPDEVHRLREDLFAAALTVHKTFIDASASRLQHNLGLLMSGMVAGAFQSSAHRELLPDLWSSLFMVVPTVSTTFASVRTMFGDLPPESIGWLLIDEAGQAVPQAAVGAIMRAKRSIVVGDPLQIPPVVSLPEKLNAEICKFFNIDQIEWSAPAASTQTLADQASRFKSTFVMDVGDREVGLPLLVHRRCQNPMFDVSNSIAYAGQMVHAVGPKKPGSIGSALGRSHWVDINGDAETKWCPDEGEAVVRMLKELAATGITNPDVFIITPFKIIEQNMRRRLDSETDLLRAFGVKLDEWCRDRVGTIHTFQGREADTVILLLGAPKASQQRARQWAASPPNIINVAVSRAKQNLYIVGSAAAWAGAGTSLQVLHRQLAQSA
ncbi:DEAD/DEAH box helicase [Serratia ficaria]|uniref:Putative DNA helicase n=1 Tax=Serratia ficaria TaxID=61651 RepID=A0A240ASH8_SERFI|nr:AAA domain-containing protein [Serratia ficaria]REF46573.1 AAA domain-containing protein [Serratia ficaria]CAI0962393.1 putative DNA helicase [Serratia ficaria]CAI0976633.1 putative DNA helicase [Serratia ficaria]CAI1020216.1 putative DNA helicase [Serratia ficaria]CAI2041500.1 putative DNA helicase [Serratia ficaria]